MVHVLKGGGLEGNKAGELRGRAVIVKCRRSPEEEVADSLRERGREERSQEEKGTSRRRKLLCR